MHMSYRALRLALGLGLLGMSHLVAAQAPPTPEDSLKGRLWTATAQRIWADTKPPQKQPAAWPTVEAFDAWRNATPDDKSELGLLWGDVVHSFGAGTRVTPIQVAQAIIAQSMQRQQSGQGRLTRLKVPILGAELAQLTQARAGVAAAVPSPSTGTTTVTAVPGAGGVTALPASPDSITDQSLRPPAPAATFISAPVEPRYFGLSPTLAGISLLLLGGLVGSLVASQLKSKRRAHRSHRSPTPPAEPENLSAMNPLEYRKLQNQNKQLRNELQQIKQQLADLQKRLPAAAATVATVKAPAQPAKAQPANTPPAPLAPVAAEELSIEEMVGAVPESVPAPPMPPATRYGPVQETPFVEERKIVDSPLPQLALMLTVNPKNPEQATFTLNPNVDQARLIGDGLTRLQKFFEYDPPLGGRITLVTASAHGQLQRHADGWQVVQRARLNIS